MGFSFFNIINVNVNNKFDTGNLTLATFDTCSLLFCISYLVSDTRYLFLASSPSFSDTFYLKLTISCKIWFLSRLLCDSIFCHTFLVFQKYWTYRILKYLGRQNLSNISGTFFGLYQLSLQTMVFESRGSVFLWYSNLKTLVFKE